MKPSLAGAQSSWLPDTTIIISHPALLRDHHFRVAFTVVKRFLLVHAASEVDASASAFSCNWYNGAGALKRKRLRSGWVSPLRRTPTTCTYGQDHRDHGPSLSGLEYPFAEEDLCTQSILSPWKLNTTHAHGADRQVFYSSSRSLLPTLHIQYSLTQRTAHSHDMALRTEIALAWPRYHSQVRDLT